MRGVQHGGLADIAKRSTPIWRANARRAVTSSLVLACVSLACERDRNEAPAEPQRGGVARIAIFEPLDFLTPIRELRWPTGLFLEHITPPLGRVTEIGDIQWLAARRLIEIGPGMRFPLRPAHWEDGTPLTAADFRLTYQMMLHPGAPGHARTRFGLVQDVVAVHDSLLFFHLLHASPQRRVDALLMPLPRHVLGDSADPRELMEWPISARPLSSGPFRVERASARELDLLANDSGAFPVPYLSRVEVRHTSVEDAVRGFVAGEFDVVDDVPVEHVEDLHAVHGARVTALVGASYLFVSWNLRDARFSDVAVRRAVAHAVDVSRLIREHTLGQADPAHGPLVPVLGIADTLTTLRHDPGYARQLLDDAGWRDRDGDGARERRGARLAFHLLCDVRSPRHELVARDIARDLRAVGMRVVVRVVDTYELANRLESGGFEAFMGRWFPSTGLNLESVWHSEATQQFNYGGFSDARVDSILVRLRYAEPGPEQDELFAALQRRVYELQPYLFLYQDPRFAAFSARIQGARPSIVSTFWNLPEWWIPAASRRRAGMP